MKIERDIKRDMNICRRRDIDRQRRFMGARKRDGKKLESIGDIREREKYIR